MKLSVPAETIAIPTADGLTLQGTRWRSSSSAASMATLPPNVVIIAHGLGEHHGRYAALAEILATRAGSDVIAMDFRGHGRSPGRRGLVHRYDDFQTDLDAVVAWVRANYPQSPMFLLGHSNGGLIVSRWVLSHPDAAAGVVLSNPVLRLAAAAPRWKINLGRALLKIAPWVTLSTPLRPGDLTRDPQRQESVWRDPLIHNRISPPLYFGMVAAGLETERRFEEIRCPLLLVLSGADPVVAPNATRAAFDASANPRKSLIFLPDALHEPFQDREGEPAMNQVADWIAEIRSAPR